MSFLEARAELAKIANGKHRFLSYEVTDDGNCGNCTVLCKCYIDGLEEIFTGETWESAIGKARLAAHNHGIVIVDVEDIQEVEV